MASKKHGGGSVMVCGCMLAAGVGYLVFIETIINGSVCLFECFER